MINPRTSFVVPRAPRLSSGGGGHGLDQWGQPGPGGGVGSREGSPRNYEVLGSTRKCCELLGIPRISNFLLGFPRILLGFYLGFRRILFDFDLDLILIWI